MNLLIIVDIVCQIGACLILFFAVYIMLRPMINGAIYFQTSSKNVEAIIRLAEITPGEKVADLGSGDGRILIALARAGAEAHGYEVNPILIMRSRRAIREAGLSGKAFVHWRSFWRADLSDYRTIVVYGIPFIMGKLGKKLTAELPPGTKVISNIFTFPNLKEIQAEGSVRLYAILDA